MIEILEYNVEKDETDFFQLQRLCIQFLEAVKRGVLLLVI